MNQKNRILRLLLCLMVFVSEAMGQGNTLSLPEVAGAPGNTVPVPVNLENSRDVVAVQFTLDLPDGLSVDPGAVAATDRSNASRVVARTVDSGSLKVMLFSDSNTPFPGRSGAVMTLPVRIPDGMPEGSEHELTLRDVVVADIDGTNILTDFNSGKLTVLKLPDLTVRDAGFAAGTPGGLMPGDPLTAVWTVENIGGMPTGGGWTENVFLVDATGNVQRLLGSVHYDGVLAAGASVSRSSEFRIPKITGIDGQVFSIVTVVPDQAAGEPSWFRENNSTWGTNSLDLGKRLLLSPPEFNVSESLSPTVRYLFSRTGRTDSAETFRLSATADPRLSVPSEITVPEGQSSLYFEAMITPDGTLNDTGRLELTVGPNGGYPEVKAVILVEDDTNPALAIELPTQDMTEGETLDVTVTAQRAPLADLPVSVGIDHSGRFELPKDVVIPAGSRSVTFPLLAVDNDVPETEADVTLSVSAPGYVPAKADLWLADNDVPMLAMSFSRSSASEGDGLLAAQLTVSRSTNVDKKVTIHISDDSDGRIHYASKTIEMPAGTKETTVNFGPIDNSTVDGDLEVTITAAVYVSSCGCSMPDGSAAGLVSASFTVIDNDGPTLTLSAPVSVVKEGESFEMTVSRNTPSDSDLTVSLSSSDASRITFPASVTVAKGSTSASFTVTTGDSGDTSDSFSTSIVAEAAGFNRSELWFSVTDQTLPDALFGSLTVAEDEVPVGASVDVDVELRNTGSYALPEHTPVSLYLNSKPIVTLHTRADIAPGGSETLSASIEMPASTGRQRLYALVNNNREVKELSYANNASEVVEVTTVSPFATTVKADRETYREGETVAFSGSISGSYEAGDKVEVFILNHGYRQTVETEVSADGVFAASFTPLKGQFGHFDFGSCFPGEGLKDPVGSFEVYGLELAASGPIKCEAKAGTPFEDSFHVTNPSALPLGGLAVKVLSAPEGLDVTASVDSQIAGGATLPVRFGITADAPSEGSDWQRVKLLVTAYGGVSLPVTLYYFNHSLRARLTSDEVSVNTTVTQSQPREYSVRITNQGEGETGRISVVAPSWISTVTPREMSSLAKGESTTVVLLISPAADMQLNVPVTGHIGINCESGDGIALPFMVEAVSDETGTLTVDVCDEYTYYTEEAPHVAGAKVRISHPTNGKVLAEGETGADGRFSATLPAGFYSVYVSADRHDSYRNDLIVDPARERLVNVNLSVQSITVDYDVREIEIEDRYEIVTTVSYETNVPQPQVVLSLPEEVDAKSLAPGESLVFNAVFTNQGLVTARDVSLLLPENFKTLRFDIIGDTEPFDLAPKQMVTVPVRVIRLDRAHAPAARVNNIDDDPCVGEPGTLYFWDCGPDRKWHRYGVAMRMGSCGNEGDIPDLGNGNGSGWSGGGWSTGGWGTGISIGIGTPNLPGNSKYGPNEDPKKPLSEKEDKGCEPCQNKFLIELVDCGLQLIPAYRVLKAVIACAQAGAHVIDVARHIDEHTTAELVAATASAVTSCISAKRAGAGDKDQEREKKRVEAIENMVMTLTSFSAKLTEDGAKETFGDWDNNVETIGSLASNILDLAGFDFDNVEEMFCPLKLLKPCDYDKKEDNGKGDSKKANALRRSAAYGEDPSYVREFRSKLAYGVYEQLALLGLRTEFFGDYAWLDCDSSELYDFFDVFESAKGDDETVAASEFETVAAARPGNLTRAQAIAFIERWNNTLAEKQDSGNSIDLRNISGYCNVIGSIEEEMISMGYSSVADLIEEAYDKALEEAHKASNSVCSSIKLQFSQEMVMTRQAFRGTLTIFNGNTEAAMTDAVLSVEIKDAEGNVATSHEFQINPESLSGFEGENGLGAAWSLAPGETGVATLVFIPTKYAAPTVGKPYSFGGSLSYVDPFSGLKVTRTLSPVTLTVKPAPVLDMTYFMQRNVISDDPLTETVEPAEDAEFSLLINNVGYGDATDIVMTTMQPEIVANEKGLDISFELISSLLNGKERTLALGDEVATEFGDIPAHGQAFAQWMFRSTLLGHFTDYDVKATHLSSYGNPDLSLLGEVSVHELVRSLEIPAAVDGEPSVGFLVNDLVDSADTPDMLYLTDGMVKPVAETAAASVASAGVNQYELTLTPSAEGWNYGYVADPTYGYGELLSVKNLADGREMPVRNFWQTDRTLRDGKEPVYETLIHFAADFESATSGKYLLTFAPMPAKRLEAVQFLDVPAQHSVAVEPLKRVRVQFNKPVAEDTFTAEDLTLNVGGKQVDCSEVSISTDDGVTFTLDLTKLTAADGLHTLTVNAWGVMDTEGFAGRNGRTASWVVYRDGSFEVKVKVQPEEAGSVKMNTETPEFGEKLTLTALAHSGYEFDSWLNGEKVLSPDTVYSFVPLAPASLVAKFRPVKRSLSVSVHEDGGSVSDLSGLYDDGSEVTLTAVPDADYAFFGWTVNGKPSPVNESELTLTLTTDMKVEAHFTREFYTQKIRVDKGWNWLSTRFSSASPFNLPEGALQAALGPDGDGTAAFEPGKSVKIQSAYPLLLEQKGRLSEDVETSVTMSEGWNWLACMSQEPVALEDAFSGCGEGDAVVSQTGFSEYYDGRWRGTLDALEPGYGYMYLARGAHELTLSNVGSGVVPDPVPAHISSEISDKVDPCLYAKTMEFVLGLTQASGASSRKMTDAELYSFCAMSGGEFRGYARGPVDGLWNMNVYGEEGDKIELYLVNNATGDLTGPIGMQSLDFEETIYNTWEDPCLVVIGEVGVNNLSALENCRLTICDVDGRVLYRDADLKTLKSLAPGLYIVNGLKLYLR